MCFSHFQLGTGGFFPAPKRTYRFLLGVLHSEHFRLGSVVFCRLGGVLKAPHLNGKRGLVQRLSTQDNMSIPVLCPFCCDVLDGQRERTRNFKR